MIINLRNLRLFGLAIIVLYGCGLRSYTPKEYIELVDKTEAYSQVYADDDFVIRCQYIPSEYLALKESSYHRALYKRKQLQYAPYYYFKFVIYAKSEENILMKLSQKDQYLYAQLTNYLNNSFSKELFLRMGDHSKIDPINYNYDGNLSIPSNLSFIISFPNSENQSEDIVFNYNDKILGINRLLQFKFPQKLFNKSNIKI